MKEYGASGSAYREEVGPCLGGKLANLNKNENPGSGVNGSASLLIEPFSSTSSFAARARRHSAKHCSCSASHFCLPDEGKLGNKATATGPATMVPVPSMIKSHLIPSVTCPWRCYSRSRTSILQVPPCPPSWS